MLVIIIHFFLKDSMPKEDVLGSTHSVNACASLLRPDVKRPSVNGLVIESKSRDSSSGFHSTVVATTHVVREPAKHEFHPLLVSGTGSVSPFATTLKDPPQFEDVYFGKNYPTQYNSKTPQNNDAIKCQIQNNENAESSPAIFGSRTARKRFSDAFFTTPENERPSKRTSVENELEDEQHTSIFQEEAAHIRFSESGPDDLSKQSQAPQATSLPFIADETTRRFRAPLERDITQFKSVEKMNDLSLFANHVRLSKEMLQCARAISQVDRKFIIARSNNALFVVDQ
jgi:hypothetical protein